MNNTPSGPANVVVSVVMPCLNEEQTVGTCVSTALDCLRRNGIPGEVIVVDNGSTDDSVVRARSAGARVVIESSRGYGCAYLRGIKEARGGFIIMGDADNTYDFSLIPLFLGKLREGYAFVNGNRFGGVIEKGAMPVLHRYFGNPLLTAILNVFFNSGFRDVYCGMKAFSREAYDRIRPISTGMEFALELTIHAARCSLKKTEVPVGLTRRAGVSKLRPLRDGWRSLRFMLMYCPNYLYVLPGSLFFGAGVACMILLFGGPLTVLGHTFDFHAMICAAMTALVGFQIINLGLFAKGYAVSHGYERTDSLFSRFCRYFKLEHGIMLGCCLVLAGAALGFDIVRTWFFVSSTVARERQLLVAFVLILIGIQTGFSSFLVSLMSLRGSTS